MTLCTLVSGAHIGRSWTISLPNEEAQFRLGSSEPHVSVHLRADDVCIVRRRSMNQIGRKVAKGAIWMVGLKFVERGIGFVSTLILARLLLPADFGLVAMAMAVFAFVEIAGSFGFDLALIRNQKAERAQYDSAWTLQVGYAILAGAALAALAIPTATFFSDPRLQGVMLVLAAVALAQGFENIGIVDFRKDFQYGRDFQLMLLKKLISFVVTMVLAYLLRSYWALLGGIVASRVVGVVLSYTMHPYRPRFDVSQIRSLMGFSQWIVLTRVIAYFGGRGPDFVLGRMLNASSLGLFSVAREVATLPTTELMFPVMRAVYPGLAAVAHDRQALTRSFLQVQGVIVMLTLPAGAAIIVLADPIVRLLLGPNWLAAIPLIQIFGLYGVVNVFQATNVSVFQVLGVPKFGAVLKAVEVVLLLPLMTWSLTQGNGLQAAAWCVFVAQGVTVPASMALVKQQLGIGWGDRLRVTWRPLLGTVAMVVSLYATMEVMGSATNAFDAAWQLGAALPAAATTFVACVWLLWRVAGRPAGAEKQVVDLVRQRLGWSADAPAEAVVSTMTTKT
jgi:O-antigen/teichoic acid export membrane protein